MSDGLCGRGRSGQHVPPLGPRGLRRLRVREPVWQLRSRSRKSRGRLITQGLGAWLLAPLLSRPLSHISDPRKTQVPGSPCGQTCGCRCSGSRGPRGASGAPAGPRAVGGQRAGSGQAGGGCVSPRSQQRRQTAAGDLPVAFPGPGAATPLRQLVNPAGDGSGHLGSRPPWAAGAPWAWPGLHVLGPKRGAEMPARLPGAHSAQGPRLRTPEHAAPTPVPGPEQWRREGHTGRKFVGQLWANHLHSPRPRPLVHR